MSDILCLFPALPHSGDDPRRRCCVDESDSEDVAFTDPEATSTVDVAFTDQEALSTVDVASESVLVATSFVSLRDLLRSDLSCSNSIVFSRWTSSSCFSTSWRIIDSSAVALPAQYTVIKSVLVLQHSHGHK